ncbi:SRPBCC family protein [Streptomyces sporangiiformans]|uniref:SRPBCC family protein n=1 Tax=Streptomyces sporangiiformans TaxID=2315329 RepID=A0A505D5H6_9ACTN|nr:SRPBCC family protein [Streptomyces sporangiiformans]TPQ16985.1 SRPBCC family protein [Streptomyces sporangiiformans]
MAEETNGQGKGGIGTLTKELPTERLVKDMQDVLLALGERALKSVASGGQGGGLGLKLPVKPVVKAGLQRVTEKAKGTVKEQVKEKLKDAVPGLGGGKGGTKSKLKVTNIVEQIDVGVPLSLAYDQWTRFEDFPDFMKRVEGVEQETDTELEWTAKIFFSSRKWHSEIIEQVPDKRIVWRSEAEKGHVDGAVTFHEVTPDLTRILLVLQYHPQGFFEHTGNLWRAQGRRARLELKHYRRHVMSEVLLSPHPEEEIEGWRGTIHEGEVVSEEEEEEEPRAEGEEEEEPRAEDEEEEEARAEEEEEEEEEDEEDEEDEEPEEEYEDDEAEAEHEEEPDEKERPKRRARR